MFYFLIDNNAIGNCIEEVNSLYKFIVMFSIQQFEIHYKTEWQRHLISCIPGIDNKIINRYNTSIKYSKFPTDWEYLKLPPFVRFLIPDYYDKRFDVPTNSISFHVREKNTYDSGWGADFQPERFVDIRSFHKLALKYANMGYKIFQVGTNVMTRFPDHSNIFCVSHLENKTILDDFYAIKNSKLLIATDSGMWVGGTCFGTKTILTNSCHPVGRWWPDFRQGHFTLNKKLVDNTGKILTNSDIIKLWGPSRYFERDGYKLLDNSFEELQEIVDWGLNSYN